MHLVITWIIDPSDSIRIKGRKEGNYHVVDGHGDLSLRVSEKNSQVLSSPPDVLRRPPALSSMPVEGLRLLIRLIFIRCPVRPDRG